MEDTKMTPTELRKFKDKNKLSIKDLAGILMQSEHTAYAKLCGNRSINKRDFMLLEKYEQDKVTANA